MTNNSEQPHRLELTVYRTLGGTIVEAVTGIFLVLTWVLILIALIRPHSLCTDPDAWLAGQGSARSLWHQVTGGLIDTALSIFALRAAYHPLTDVKMPLRITTVAQLVVMVTYTRIMALVISVLTLCITIHDTTTRWDTLATIGLYTCIAVAVINAVVCTLMVYRRRDPRYKVHWKLK